MVNSAKILVLSFTDLRTDSRVLRQLKWLSESYSVIVAGFTDPELPGVRFVPVPRQSKWHRGEHWLRLFRVAVFGWRNHYFRQHEVIGSRQNIDLLGEPFDLIVANDLDTLPLALELAKQWKCKVLFDAHEYSPDQNRVSWRQVWFTRLYVHRLCRDVILKVDGACTVSPGIQAKYRDVFGLDTELVLNAPNFWEVPVVEKREGNRIRLVHHGLAVPGRSLENMIYFMDLLDGRFELDMVLLPYNPGYLEKLQNLVRQRPRLRILPPSNPTDIVADISHYDIGIYLLQAKSFNQIHCLPNKFFDFIQARLGIVIWPLPDMAEIVQRHQLGLVGPDFSLEGTAQLLNAITRDEIDLWRKNADSVAEQYSAQAQRKVFLGLTRRLLEN